MEGKKGSCHSAGMILMSFFFWGICSAEANKCLSGPCQNNGICIAGLDNYTCQCPQDPVIYFGKNCELLFDACHLQLCLNNGTCHTTLGSLQYNCTCLPGFTGLNCEVEINECESNPCQNGAECKDYVASYGCTCAAGYEGVNCEIDIDECTSNPCINGGICNDLINSYTCNCNGTGFQGTNCKVDILECASDPCINNATCQEGVRNYSCLCWPGYTGRHCEIDINECFTEPCKNNGTCLERSRQDHYGNLLQFKSTFSYANAPGYVCICQHGFTGENCSVNIDECESGPCMNEGTCEDQTNGFHCHCAPGFTGVTCQTNINECEGNPCEHGGTCEDGIADYICHCSPLGQDGITWGGKNCSVELTGCLQHNCYNGGRCIPNLVNNIHGFSCRCPPGFYDASCSTSTTFSLFNGFVIMQAADGNQTSRHAVNELISISMRFRTTLPNALLVYRGNLLNEYIHIQIYSGHLMSTAVISDQVMNISFTEAVNDGAWHELRVHLGKNLLVKLSHLSCPNQTCSDSRLIKSATPPSPTSFQTTFIGGYSGTYLGFQENFTGCMQDLEIDNRPVLPQSVPDYMAWNFKLGCEKTSWCDQNPCNSNGMCVDLWTSYTCDCFRPFVGPSCIQEHIPVTFSHNNSTSSSSFVIMDNPGPNFAISFFIRTQNPNSFILQLSNATTVYLSAYLQNRSISIKAQGTSLDSLINLADGNRRLVEIRSDEGRLTVKESNVVLLEHLLPDVSVHAFDIIHIGQDADEDSSVLGEPFKGCLQDVRVNNNLLEFYPLEIENYTLPLGVYTNKTLVNVIKGCVSDDSCKSDPCRNGGNCSVTWNDFECKCLQQFTGRSCEEKVWCGTDPCPLGSRCLDLQGGYECHANATFRGGDPIVYVSNELITRDLTSISVDFKTRDTAAVLLQVSHGAESIWLGFHDSHLQFKLYSGNSVEALTLFSSINISDGQWHSVHVTMEDPSKISSRWIIIVDRNSNVTSTVTAGNINFLQDNANLTLGNNFTGCFGVVRISGIYLPYINHKVFTKTEQFIIVRGSPVQIGCFGTEVCSPSPCLNDGQCEDLFDLFQCNCAAGWEGIRCELSIDDCVSRPCIHGNCSNLVQGYRCSCEWGYTGVNCESDIDDCVDHRCKNQGRCIDGLNSYHCNCLSQFTGRYCELLYPPVYCGESFSCENGGLCTDGLWGANCTCGPGFAGERCEEAVSVCVSNPCQNGATCQNTDNTFECICATNFAGEHCELDRGKKVDSIPILAVAVPVVCGSVLLIVIALILVVLTARKKRQTEGTYNPSQQEVAGARLEMDSVLKVPPEERLI
ncbi:protein crumbs homolog 1-like isoform X2 [Narcine bancroftii]|uniref:protein crumbs homolog 1-like isoform X2 n=1 Tax=Narcine bancroftii TaxID=1343680 RepID=UPI0038313B52